MTQTLSVSSIEHPKLPSDSSTESIVKIVIVIATVRQERSIELFLSQGSPAWCLVVTTQPTAMASPAFEARHPHQISRPAPR